MKKSDISTLVPVENTGNALSRRQFIGVSALGLTGALLGGCNAVPAAPGEKEKAKPAVAGAIALGALGASVGNRAPLQSAPMHALPLGSVRANGWLLYATAIAARRPDRSRRRSVARCWPQLGVAGRRRRSVGKRAVLSQRFGAARLYARRCNAQNKAKKWIDAMLNSQREDGFFGPKSNDDWWPRMVATYAIRDYGEATGDPRVAPFLTKYHRYMADNLDARALKDWGKARAGDQIDTVFWNYNRTGDAFLLTLADTLAKQAYPWREIQTENKFMEWAKIFIPNMASTCPRRSKCRWFTRSVPKTKATWLLISGRRKPQPRSRSGGGHQFGHRVSGGPLHHAGHRNLLGRRAHAVGRNPRFA